MEEQLKGISTLTLKPGEPLPPGEVVLEKRTDGSQVVRQPIKYQSIQGRDGLITAWERKPREDFI